MKKSLPIIMNIVWLISSVVFCLYSVYDIHRTLMELANTPSSSGIDYWGIGWASGLVLFGLSVMGLLLSAISSRTLRMNHCARLHTVSIVFYILLLIVSILLFYI